MEVTDALKQVSKAIADLQAVVEDKPQDKGFVETVERFTKQLEQLANDKK
jgi:hypothetical protein